MLSQARMVRNGGFGLVGLAVVLAGCSIQVGVEGQGDFESGPVRGAYAPLSVAAPPPYESHCSPAPALMANALCVCDDLSITGSLRARAGARGVPADVGVGRDVDLASGTSIDGSLRVGGEVSSAGSLAVAHHLWARDGVHAAGSLDVGGDLASGRDVSGAGDLTVRGQLRVAGDDDWAGSQEIGGRASYDAPRVAPCGCDAASIYDVAKAVAIARDNNDNALGGISSIGSTSLTLRTGRYYIKTIASVGDLRVRIDGDVQLYIDGDLETVGDGNISIAKDGSLDLFINGSVHTVGDVSLGDPSRPDAFRLYVGGASSEIALVGSQSWSGVIYAPTATISLTGDTEIRGAIVAGSLHKTGDLDLRAVRATTMGERCEAKPTVNPPPAASPTPPAPPASPEPPAAPESPCPDPG